MSCWKLIFCSDDFNSVQVIVSHEALPSDGIRSAREEHAWLSGYKFIAAAYDAGDVLVRDATKSEEECALI